jgi:type II secretory pathway component GspD/PulD (secretin)
MNHGQMIGGGAGTTQLGSFVTASTNAVNPIGKGINYLMKSDKLNLAAVIEASKTDSRTKYVASPIVMTVDNKEAIIEATSSRQFLTGCSAVSSSYAGSGLPSPNYSAKEIGITLKITPKINPNGTVMLTVEEEYSQVSGKQTMLTPSGSSYTTQDIDVPVTRKMSADISLENRQSVILGGLTTKNVVENESGIPILKDIPWVGKWLFGSVEQDEQRSELLIFMTPYVLDDAESAKAEALRRKNVLTDPNPWDDNGWSASPIADPVSRKEQLRRFNDEWRRQDEERKMKLAIEKAKVERARKLEKMSEEERKAWLEIHKEDLKKEEREAFEKKVEEQKDLKEFVEQLKKQDLEKSEKKLKEAEKE